MIKKIIHIADIHIRTVQLHDLYRKQIETFLLDVNKMITEEGLEHDEIRFVITGDIYHQKITVSNEQILLTSWLFNQLAFLGKVVIIPGNHDFLENNTERLDTITPIVQLTNDPDNIFYFKDSGVYTDENIKWVVFSLYQHNERPQFTKGEGFYVGLFHGPIQGMSTDLGYKFDDSYDRLNFVDLDLLLCGDIHLRQVFELPGKGQAVMIGSMIQQNFGENIKNHGYGLFDIATKKYTFHDLKNEQPFLHFTINDIKDIETESEHLVNS